ncbi:hypothetical protein JYU14_02250 [Simkania negevensis]|uniref:ResB-like domain-containing protein n=1 Tax=Simkania negevensis TaxID=83561 RepID=A0ABS3ATP9_9BACT|nr:hypothetical protein [Simkania negevensis]
MIGLIKKTYHFIGSIWFALVLIVFFVLFVLLGTFLEAHSGSHLFAAHFTYSSIYFEFLLYCLFCNILFAALRRWPFRWKHLPFLLTHLGLLMVIGGVILKVLYGVQGSMVVLEGGIVDEIFMSNTLGLHVEERGGDIHRFALTPHMVGKYGTTLNVPDGSGTSFRLVGMVPHVEEEIEYWIKKGILDVEELGEELLVTRENNEGGIKRAFHPELGVEADWYAVETDDLLTELHQVIAMGVTATFFAADGQKFFTTPLSTLLEGVEQDGSTVRGALSFKRNDNGSLIDAALHVLWQEKDVVVPLMGEGRGRNRSEEGSRLPFFVELSRARPLVAFIKEKGGAETVSTVTKWGGLISTSYDNRSLGPYVLVDDGFLGYGVFAKLPYLHLPTHHSDHINAEKSELLYAISEQLGLADYSLHAIEEAVQTALRQQGMTLEEALERQEIPPSLERLAQIAGYTEETPPTLFTHIARKFIPTTPTLKLEENTPLLVIQARKGGVVHEVPLRYDLYGRGLKWPVLGGEYLVRFQPQYRKIPYRLRLHDARQINYPGTEQPYSFESVVTLSDDQQLDREAVISMNKVLQTFDGYRFYLSSLFPKEETQAQQAQFAVNHDPAKYWLTYPGGVIVAIGIVLLFWLKGQRKVNEAAVNKAAGGNAKTQRAQRNAEKKIESDTK